MIFIIINPSILENIKKLNDEIETYQSNHFGYYNRSELINAYNSIPSEIKTFLIPSRKKLKNLWRGCDGLSEDRVISFTTNKGYASIFGVYTIPFHELEKYSALIDTEKFRKLALKLHINSDVGDDEDEVLVINPIWKNFNINKYFK